MRRRSFILCLSGALLLSACGAEQDPPPPMNPVGDMKQTMDWVLDPAADVVWGFAGFIVTAEGETDLAPKNDEEWAQVKHAAWVLAESGNLLMMPGLAQDSADWTEYSQGLRTMGNRLIEIAESQDPEALFEAGGHLYNICLACHQAYARDLRQD